MDIAMVLVREPDSEIYEGFGYCEFGFLPPAGSALTFMAAASTEEIKEHTTFDVERVSFSASKGLDSWRATTYILCKKREEKPDEDDV